MSGFPQYHRLAIASLFVLGACGDERSGTDRDPIAPETS